MPDFNLLQKFGLLGLSSTGFTDWFLASHPFGQNTAPTIWTCSCLLKKKRHSVEKDQKSGIIRRSNHHQVMYRKPLVNCLSKSVQDFGKPSTASPDQLGSSVGEEPSKAMAAYCRSNYRSSQLAMNKGATYSVWTQCFCNSHLPIFWNFPNWHF